MSAAPGFVADAMLGRLTRWLRLAGYDVLYDARMDDNELVRLARQSGRVLLTRDRQLAQRPRVTTVLVASEKAQEQLRQVLCQYPSAERPPPRCALCNGELIVAGRHEVEGEVPAYVWVNQDAFRRCRSCGRIHWEGTHWRRISAVLRGAMGPGDCDGVDTGT